MKLDLSDIPRLWGVEREWAYNALDCTGTREILDALLPRLTPVTARTYAFERALQAPAMAMMLEGVLVDTDKRNKRLRGLEAELRQITKRLNDIPTMKEKWDATELETGICDPELGKRHKWPKGEPDATRKCAVCGKPRTVPSPFNPGSSHQKKRLFYKILGIPPYHGKDGEVTTDEDALEKIGKKYPQYRDITDTIVEYQKVKKQIGWLGARLSTDGRYPSSINVGTAWTGRFSSSKNPYGLGGNLQNVAERLRDVFVADPGWMLFYADLEQAESNCVAHLADDEEYIAAHVSGDPHTYVSRLIWPDLPWTGVLEEDKKLAKDTLPEWDKVPGHDLRFQAKRIQHGSNYGLTPPGIALIAHIPQEAARSMQKRYFSAFPKIKDQQRGVIALIEDNLPIITPLGRRFKLFGRPDDKHTHKQGLAANPQSMVADILNLSMWRVWKELGPRVRLLAQVHDAILGMVRLNDFDTIRDIKRLMSIPVKFPSGKVMVLGVEVATGLNWGKKSPSNLEGLTTWKEPNE